MSVQIDGFEDIADVIEEAVRDVCEGVDYAARASAAEAEKSAENGYALAEYPGVNDVVVKSTETETDETLDIDVAAEGDSVLFIEFGTGVKYTSEPHPLAEEYGMIRGEYGEGRGANPKGWLYKGVAGNSDAQPSTKVPGLMHTRGNPASMAMYNAGQLLEQEIDRRLGTE